MNRKMITTCALGVSLLMLAAGFVTATNYIQLAIATLIYPVLAYAVFKAFPKRITVVPAATAPRKSEEIHEHLQEEKVDSDKRAFLKLIGTVGLSYFLFSIFSRKTETLFFNRAVEQEGIIADKEGNKINPAERQPTDGYQITEIDEGETIYTGYTNKSGGWYIMMGHGESGAFRYARGDSDFPGSWVNREQLGYDYFYKVFGQG